MRSWHVTVDSADTTVNYHYGFIYILVLIKEIKKDRLKIYDYPYNRAGVGPYSKPSKQSLKAYLFWRKIRSQFWPQILVKKSPNLCINLPKY